MKGQTK